MSRPQASIIIPTKNAGPLFDEVLDAVYDQSGSFEVLVIDSGSTDGTVSRVEASPAKLIEIPPEEFDHGGTRNLGARRTHGDFIVFLTQDATPLNGWLQALTRPLRQDDKMAGVYSRQLPRPSATPMKRHFLESFYGEMAETRSLVPDKQLSRDDIFFSNVSSALRRSVWEQIPFPTDVIMSEDQKWALSVLKSGYKIRYEPASKVRHSHKEGARDIFKRYFDSGASLNSHHLASNDSKLTREMIMYQISELHFLVEQNYALWIPYALAYSGAKFLGLQFGRHHDRLPTWLVQRWSDTLSRKYEI